MKEVEYLDLMEYPYISSDLVPDSATCVLCGNKAWRSLFVNGGSRHNDQGIYCWTCGRDFIFMLARLKEYRRTRLCRTTSQTSNR
jgi:hypothetical protein